MNLGRYIGAYCAYSNDPEFRREGSSGGIISHMLAKLLDQDRITGAIVIRMSDQAPLKPEAFIARSRKEIISASGSKYCPISFDNVLGQIEEEDRLAITSIPCQLRQVKKNIIYTFGLFCSGTSDIEATYRILWDNGIDPMDVRGFRYRSDGWPGYCRIELSDDVIHIPIANAFDNTFNSYRPKRCHNCDLRYNPHADISFGDAWHLKEQDDQGISIVITRNQELDDLLNQMRKEGEITAFRERISNIRRSQGDTIRNRIYHFKSRLEGAV